VLVEEALVDFYDVTRQALKVTEIGMAGAKIIYPRLDTKILQAEKCIPNGARPFEQQTFRQLKNETLRRKASIAQNAGHRRYKGRLAQIER
jgi:hypothetical protein